MYIKINKIQIGQLKSAMMFLPIIAYAPFFFTQWVSPALRVGCFFLLSIYLFFSATRYSKNDGVVFGLLILLVITFVSRNSAGTLGIVSVGNYCLTILFGWGLYRHLTTSRPRAHILLELYVKFFYFVSICSLLSLVYFLILGEFDLFGFKSDVYQHLVTPFGVLFKKSFGPITLYRSSFYFVEPVHVAIFYAANIVIVAPLLKSKEGAFVAVNFLGGLLSLSMTFFIVLFVLYGWKKTKSIYSLVGVLVGGVCLILLTQILDVASYSSGVDRFDRFYLFYIAMEQANMVQLLFGHGVANETGFDKAFNSGFTLSIYQAGFVGTVLEILILYRLSSSFLILVFFMLAASVVDPIHMPLFWLLVVIISRTLNDEAVRPKISDRNSLIKMT